MAFAVHVAADAAAEYVPAIPLWLDVVASIVAFLGAVWFTRWYPAAVRRRFANAAASWAEPDRLTFAVSIASAGPRS